MFRRNLLRTLSPVVAAALVVGCGARSGLEAGQGPSGQGGQGGSPVVPVACVAGPVTLARAKPAVMLVLDRSTSMGQKLDDTSEGTTRWESLTNALSSTLPSVDDSMAIGALLYPSKGSIQGGALGCSVPPTLDLSPATGQVASLLALMHSTSPGGTTPTADALNVASSLLLDVRAATAARAVVLATDGAPDCNASLDSSTCRCAGGKSCKGKSTRCLDDARTVQIISKYQEMGLPTYVIGIQAVGDDSFSDVLDAMADAGGRPKMGGEQHYYAARSEAELDAAFAVIRDQVGRCTYLTTSVPDGQGTIAVTQGETTLPYDASGAEGWMWGNKTNGEIVLLGSACAAATLDPGAILSANVQCNGS